VLQIVRFGESFAGCATIDAPEWCIHARAMSEFALWDIDHWSLDELAALD